MFSVLCVCKLCACCVLCSVLHIVFFVLSVHDCCAWVCVYDCVVSIAYVCAYVREVSGTGYCVCLCTGVSGYCIVVFLCRCIYICLQVYVCMCVSVYVYCVRIV